MLRRAAYGAHPVHSYHARNNLGASQPKKRKSKTTPAKTTRKNHSSARRVFAGALRGENLIMMRGGGWGRCHNIAQESPLRKYECSLTSAVLARAAETARGAR